MYSSEIEETISENKSDTNKPVNKKEERRKTIDFEKIYNASYFLIPDETDSIEERNEYINFYNIRTKHYTTSSDFLNKKPLPRYFTESETNKIYSDDDMEDIKKGWKSIGMNDRWFIYFDDDKLFFYRATMNAACHYIAYFKYIDNHNSFMMYKIGFNQEDVTIKESENSAHYWIDYLISSLLIGFRRALINPEEIYNNDLNFKLDQK